MKHQVEIKENGNTVAVYENCTKAEAIRYAKKESTKNNSIFLSGDNGQCTVYLNPDGNYEITGKSW